MNAFAAWSVLIVSVCTLIGFGIWYTHNPHVLWALIILILVTPSSTKGEPDA